VQRQLESSSESQQEPRRQSGPFDFTDSEDVESAANNSSLLSGKSKKKQQRRRWTPEEERAIVDGVQRLGEGRWSDIRSSFLSILRNRTNVEIKDKWRNMSKKK